MSYILRSGLSCCEVDSHVVFLDVKRDRYFRLSSSNEAAIRCFLTQRDVPTEQARNLVQAGILVESAHQMHETTAPAIDPPSLSAVEQPGTAGTDHPSVITILEIMTIIWSIRRQLRSRPLADIIDDTASIRRRKAEVRPATGTAQPDDRLLRAAAEFDHARRYVPIEPGCLPDSLSLVRFLSRRGLSARIVFGVILNPFAAHCWAQAGETVLNDTLSNAQSHTPIKVI